MTEPATVVHRVILHRWRAGENSADIAKAVSLTEQQVLNVIWDERADRLRVLALLRRPSGTAAQA